MTARSWRVVLSDDERSLLEEVVSSGRGAARRIRRARILLDLDEGRDEGLLTQREAAERSGGSGTTAVRGAKAYAQRGEFQNCADESFDCVMCGICSSRCPAEISHPQVAELARRLNGKYIQPEAKHLTERVEEIKDGKFESLIQNLMAKPIDQIKELYNSRDIEA